MIPLWLSVLIGVGAFYTNVDIRDVCLLRNKQGWAPETLNCNWYCLATYIEQGTLGEYWLVHLPGCGLEVCHIVDVGMTEHIPALKARGEVIEISYKMAQECGWVGYTEGVVVLRGWDSKYLLQGVQQAHQNRHVPHPQRRLRGRFQEDSP